MTRTLVIGDIHGCLESLDALLSLAAARPVDRIITVGDLIHRGPDSAGVVRRMREIRAELVLGSHERYQAKFRRALASFDGDVSKIRMKGKAVLAETERSLSPEDVAYMESARLFVRVPGGLAVHAGILPSMKHIPDDDEIAGMSKKDREKLEQVIHVRYVRGRPDFRVTVEFHSSEDVPLHGGGETIPVGPELIGYLSRCRKAEVKKRKTSGKGAFLPLGEQTPADPFWADIYDGRFGHVYFGHEPFPTETKPRVFPHATGLDLGCVFGNRLAAIVVETGEIFTVPAKRKFAGGLREI
jgi:Icc-related predicted phosphoesterase